MADIIVSADPFVTTCELTTSTGAIILSSAARNPDLDQTFDMGVYDKDYNQPYLFAVTCSIHGNWISKALAAGLLSATSSIHGTWTEGVKVTGTAAGLTLSISGDWYTTNKRNWVKWSKIGSLDFTIDRTKVAGERPLDWKGLVYKVRKLGNKVIAYGENGVTILHPSGVAWGMQTIYRVGLKSKDAMAGTDSIHWFIDKAGQLWELTGEGLKKLDYSEYLASLSSTLTIMSYDEYNNALYICDGTIGFVYRDGSLGKGPINVTGITYQSGTLYVASPATITSRIPEICTDIYDLGTRRGKTIHSLEIGTDVTGTLSASIHYRINKASAFAQTGWYTVDRRGMSWITAYGQEFKFAFKVAAYEYFEIDYIRVNRTIHDN